VGGARVIQPIAVPLLSTRTPKQVLPEEGVQVVIFAVNQKLLLGTAALVRKFCL